MIKMFSCALLVIAAFAAASSAIAADAQGVYFGGGVGAVWLSAYNENNNNENYCCPYYDDYLADTSDSFGSFTAFTGYRFGPYVAAEVGYFYADNPEWDQNFTYIGELNDVFNSFVQLEYESVQVSVLGMLPFANIWEVYVRGGAEFSQVQADQHLVRIVDGARFDATVDNKDTDFLFGIGAGVSPTPAWHFRVEFTTVPIDDHLLNANGDTSIDSFKIEVLYRPFAKP